MSSSARIAVVGMSAAGPTCGARDHALLLAEALRGEQVECSLHWLGRDTEALRAGRGEIHRWTRALEGELARARPDGVLLHYSVFAFSHRGVPVHVAPTLAALRRVGAPVVTVLHEFVYPWRHRGWRARVWATTQRAVLVDVLRSSAAVVVTTDFRARWLATRPWLPKRPAVLAPVFSNLPAARVASVLRGASASGRSRPAVGLFGYSFQGAAVAQVIEALALARAGGLDVQLRLLGAPGRPSAVADAWLAQARAYGVERALSFSGVLAAQELADALAACELLLFVDGSGPSSRKGTLAASLASGRPVVAIDGPRRWGELVEARAARVVAPTAQALADAIGELLAQESLREQLGARGEAFAREGMSVERAARAVRGALAEVGAVA